MRTIKVTRTTTESEMGIVLDFSPLKADYRKAINTPIMFLNHMIEHIAYRAGFNIETTLKLDEYVLSHLICEDLGIALGKAVKEYIDTTDGAAGYGDAVGMIDEARASCAVSFESRAYIDIDYHNCDVPVQTEGMNSEDLETFLEGLVHSAPHLQGNPQSGRHPFPRCLFLHCPKGLIYEAVFLPLYPLTAPAATPFIIYF